MVALAGGAPPRLDIQPAGSPLPGRPWRPHGVASIDKAHRLDASVEDAKSSGY
jgi:hypothetical protein